MISFRGHPPSTPAHTSLIPVPLRAASFGPDAGSLQGEKAGQLQLAPHNFPSFQHPQKPPPRGEKEEGGGHFPVTAAKATAQEVGTVLSASSLLLRGVPQPGEPSWQPRARTWGARPRGPPCTPPNINGTGCFGPVCNPKTLHPYSCSVSWARTTPRSPPRWHRSGWHPGRRPRGPARGGGDPAGDGAGQAAGAPGSGWRLWGSGWSSS